MSNLDTGILTFLEEYDLDHYFKRLCDSSKILLKDVKDLIAKKTSSDGQVNANRYKLISNAARNRYVDFKSPLAYPQTALLGHLKQCDLEELQQNVFEGK